ncbi:MAG: phytoene/squalene synthase family protein [Chitinophagales bacterium]
MLTLYHDTTFQCSRLITQAYSTSFTLGIKALDSKLHDAIYGIYAFVRYADEIVDTFHDYDKATLLQEFKADTYTAIERGISTNPVIHAYQIIVNQYYIEKELIEAFFNSMEMDLNQSDYTSIDYNHYIYGSAEVVGLMCLRVFCEGNEIQYNQLKDSAQRLGSAFQKVNFLRDMRNDFQNLGRVYFPNVDFTNFQVSAKKSIEADIEADFEAAYKGILALPKSARFGVYLAYRYYKALFVKIKNTPPEVIKQERLRIPNPTKAFILFKSALRNYANAM